MGPQKIVPGHGRASVARKRLHPIARSRRTARSMDPPRSGMNKWIQTWGNLTLLGVAEELLANASLVREANALCAALGADVEFQLTIQRPFPCAMVDSQYDSVAGLAQSETGMCTVPLAVVRAISWRSCSIQFWTTKKLVHQVSTLQRIRSHQHNPTVAQHTDVHTELLGGSLDHFSHMGTVCIPLFPLAMQSRTAWRMPIQSNALSVLGHCRVSVAYVCGNEQEVLCKITVDELTGITAADAHELHLQLHLDSCIGVYDAHAEVYATRPILLRVQSCSSIRMQRTVRLPKSAQTTRFWESGAAAVHILARPSTMYLDRLTTRDAQKEALYCRSGMDLVAALGMVPPSSQGRVHECKRRIQTHHGVHVQAHLLETDTAGMPHVAKLARIQPQHFLIHQSRAHCLALSFTFDAALPFPWTGIRRIEMGNVQLVDSTGTVHACDLHFTTLQRCATVSPLQLEALWQPEQELLQKPTPSKHHVRITLRIEIDIQGSHPLVLAFPLFMRIHASGHTAPINAHDVPWSETERSAENAMHAFFSVALTPGHIRSARDLWRVDTRSVQVPGDTHTLPEPRGLSLVADYFATYQRDRHALEVYRTRERLLGVSLPHTSAPNLAPVLRVWQDVAHPFTWVRITLIQLHSHWRPYLHKLDPELFTAEATFLDLVACPLRGWLEIQRDAHADVWMRAWFELRPYVCECSPQPVSARSAKSEQPRTSFCHILTRCACPSSHLGYETQTRSRCVHGPQRPPTQCPERSGSCAVEVRVLLISSAALSMAYANP